MGAGAKEMARFAELLREEESVYREVLAISRRQSELVRGGDSARLLEALAAKGELVAKVEEIGAELTPLKEAWKGAREAAAENQRVEIETLLGSISVLLEEIISEENAVEELIGQKRSESVERIKKLQTGRRMNKAYGDRAKDEGRFTDSTR